MKYGVIGDPHLGFKAYDTVRRTEEASLCFEKAVAILYDHSVRLMFIAGDLTDDTTWANWVEKRTLRVFKNYPDVKFMILGGNHDSTKTYNSVSALDVLDEYANVEVFNDFTSHEFVVDGLHVLAIPHMKSQTAFLEAVDAVTGHHDVCLIHCMVDSQLELGPNDLNIDKYRLGKLADKCTNVWIGHQHIPEKIGNNVYVPGSTFELNFGELGARYVYIVNDEVPARVAIPQPRQMLRLDIPWINLTSIIDGFADLDPETIYKLCVAGIPPEEYSSAVAAMDVVLDTFKGDVVYELGRTGHKEIEIKTIDASFDLTNEFESYCKDNDLDCPAMLPLLQDAIAEVQAEEEDLAI